MHAAHHQLRAVDVVNAAPSFVGAAAESLHCLGVVLRRDQIVEHDSIGDLAGELHHLHARGTDVDRHFLGTTLLVHIVELDAIQLYEFTVHGDGFVVQQCAHRCDDFAHGPQWLGASDAHFLR